MSRRARSLADARAEVSDDIVSHQAFRAGFARGLQAALDLTGVRTDDPADVIPGNDALLDDVAARLRADLAREREYRTPALTAAQIAAQASWSWRQVERDIAQRGEVGA